MRFLQIKRTEKPQQWHKPKGNVDEGPVLFSEIQFVHHTYGKRKAEEGALQMEKMKKYRACTSIFSRVTEDSIRELCTSLEAGNNASLFTTMMRSNGCQPLPSTSSETEESTVSQHPSSTPDEIVWNRVTVNSQQAIKIEEATRGQSDCAMWFQERSVRITASFFGRVCRRLATTPPDALVNSIINQKVHRSMPTACAWGKNNEVRAMDAYKLNMQEVGHSGLEIRQSGLVINTECAFLGASPDGIVYDPVSEDPNGLLEIKCPYTYRDVNPQEAAQQKTFFCTSENHYLLLKTQHHYYYQVQGQMAICKRKWCDFVVFTNAGISVERIKFNEEFWKNMVTKLKTFYVHSVLPKLSEKLK